MTNSTPPNSTTPVVADSAPIETEPVEFGRPMPVPTGRRSGRGGTVALLVATFVAVGGLAFAGGRLSAPAAAAGDGGIPVGPLGGFGPGASFLPGGSFAPGGNGVGGGRLFDVGGTTLRGEVTAISDSSITVRLQDGSSVTVPLDAETTYHRATPAAADAVQMGDEVAVQAGTPSFSPGSSPATGGPGSTFGGIQFGPAVDVTVTSN